MKKERHVLSYAVWVLAVLLLLVFGVAGGAQGWLWGAVLAVVFALAGIFYYRRGR